MTKCSCGYEKFFHNFMGRLHKATRPAVKMWQKENNKPLTWPDPITLIKWLTRKAKGELK